MSNLQELNAKIIRSSGRTLSEPFLFALKDEKITAEKIFRILPGKRVVFLSEWHGQKVVVKLFVDAQQAARHARREREGIERMRAAGVATAAILHTEQGIDWTAVIYQFLQNTRSLAVAYKQADQHGRLTLIQCAARNLAKIHASGFIHTDCHPDNFLLAEDTCYVLDGDGIRESKKLTQWQQNFGQFLAQFNEMDEALIAGAIAAYRQVNAVTLDEKQIQEIIRAIRFERVDDFVEKVMRDCTLVKVNESFKRFSAVIRQQSDRLMPVLANPDEAIADGEILKAGNSATVARIALVDGSTIIVKRYNIKSFGHRLERAFVTTRATHSWQNAHRLNLLGIETAAPLAILEERFGFMHGRSFYLMESVDAPNIADYWALHGVTEHELALVKQLFANLKQNSLYHGDCKATNILRTPTGLCLIDLDSMRVERNPEKFTALHQKDIARFKKNFQDQPDILNALNGIL
ncbi:MAG TPA: lipopolysaccharide kinase InaA family protein [Pseudomonadales bacterium]|nr:lipopolysaccharide kinase InaA family protein [Pseudomonadales bacterium]